MSDKEKLGKQLREKPGGVEKPLSPWGVPFTDVREALPETKPMPRDQKKKGDRSDKG